MAIDSLAPERAATLLQRQDALQAEARHVLADLNLPSILSQAGEPVQLGSSVVGLMTWRDIDIHVYCSALSADLAFVTMRAFASHPRVEKLGYANRRDGFRAHGLPDGYYWGMRYVTDGAVGWKIDVWFVAHDGPRPERDFDELMTKRLTPEMRLSILWIKDVWHRRSEYRDTIVSMDIYRAVLERGVRTPGEFERYLRDRGDRADRPVHQAK